MCASPQRQQDATEYDTVTRRISRTTVKPETSAGTVTDRRYDYDAIGSITSVREAPQVGQADNQCFRYDALRRLTSAWTPATAADCATDPTVAALGGPAPYWTGWTFDAIGNRRGQTSHTAGGNITQTVTVPDSGPGAVRPHSASQVTTTAPGQSPVTGSYGYDRTGNTVSRPGPSGDAQALTWDVEGKVATAVEGTATVSNVYDVDGQRLIRRDPTGTTLYLPGVELRRQDGATTGTRYYSFAGKTVAQRTGAGGLVWVYSDHQGTQQVMVHALTAPGLTLNGNVGAYVSNGDLDDQRGWFDYTNLSAELGPSVDGTLAGSGDTWAASAAVGGAIGGCLGSKGRSYTRMHRVFEW